MESNTNNTPLIAIVGQTASGKTALALELAQQFNGEIICADSRTVYKGMDIATAKPSTADQKIIPHHLLDIAEPDRPITAAMFQERAQQAISDILSRGKLPFLVGGTGLYIDAVLYNFSFAPNPPENSRKQFAGKSVEELQALIHDRGLHLPENAKNPRHLIRQLEIGKAYKARSSLRSNTLIIGLPFSDPIELRKRLTSRLEQMFAKGLESEAKELAARFGWSCASLHTIGYQEFQPYFADESNLDFVKKVIVQHSLQYAKRQKSWFKRNQDIHWICKKEEIVDLITSLLNKNYIG